MVELVEKRFDDFMPFLAQHDFVGHVRGHCGVDTVKAHESRPHCRPRIVRECARPVIEFDRGYFASRKTNARLRPESNRFVRRRIPSTEAGMLWRTQFQQPAELHEVHPRSASKQRRHERLEIG